MRKVLPLFPLLVLILFATPLAAKDSLGVFGDWGAFRDTEVPRCYAIAAAQESRASRQFAPYASVGTWPADRVRGQVHFRLSRELRDEADVSVTVGTRSFSLQGRGNDAWAQDARMDAAIVAEMRAAGAMRITARDRQGRRFSDRYSLDGAATALDAATVGCANLPR